MAYDKPGRAQTKPFHPVLSPRPMQLHKPRNMARLDFPPQLTATAAQIALDVFTDVCNAGKTFQEALAAIYVTGLHHGANAGAKTDLV